MRDKRTLSPREEMIYDYISPRFQKQFIKMSPAKRKKMVDAVIKDLSRKNYDVSELQSGTVRQKELRGRMAAGFVRKAATKSAVVSGKGSLKAAKLPFKAALFTGKKIKERKTKEVLLDQKGNLTRQKVESLNYPSKKDAKKEQAKQGKNTSRRGKNILRTVGRQVDKALSSMQTDNRKKNRSIDEIQKEWRDKYTTAATKKAGKIYFKGVKKTAAVVTKLIVKLIFSILSCIAQLLLPLLPFILIAAILVAIITALFGAAAEEESQTQPAGVVMVSESVLQYRDRILSELKKYGKTEYIDLFLAIVMQESGGNGTDIFQCSASSVDKSIKNGVRIMCGHMADKRVKVSSVDDMEHIKVALQAYNYGGGYIDFINDTQRLSALKKLDSLGKWTQESALDFQKKQSANKIRTGVEAKLLGPYAYGDAYYVEHVLRYYNTGSSAAAAEVKGIELGKRMQYLFPNGIPSDEATGRSYMQTVPVTIYTPQGKTATMYITVHKKLVKAYQQAFAGMYQIKFPIDAGQTAAFCWRMMASDGSKRSYHSYGSCIDINSQANPATYTSGVYSPGLNPLSVNPAVIKIWADAGFYWGGNWTGYYRDTMHFTYTNN